MLSRVPRYTHLSSVARIQYLVCVLRVSLSHIPVCSHTVVHASACIPRLFPVRPLLMCNAFPHMLPYAVSCSGGSRTRYTSLDGQWYSDLSAVISAYMALVLSPEPKSCWMNYHMLCWIPSDAFIFSMHVPVHFGAYI